MATSVFNQDTLIRPTAASSQAHLVELSGSSNFSANSITCGGSANLDEYLDNQVINKQTADSVLIPEPWQPLSLSPGVTAGQYERAVPSIRLHGTRVYVEGSISFNKTSSGDTVATFDSKYRPEQNVYILVALTGYRIARVCYTRTGSIIVEWVYQLDSTDAYTGNLTWLTISASWDVLNKYEKPIE